MNPRSSQRNANTAASSVGSRSLTGSVPVPRHRGQGRETIQIASALAGKRIAITGTTGFLGTALLERLLRQVPDADIVLLLRAGRRSTVQQRATREIFRNDAFDVLRAQLRETGQDFDATIQRRVTVLSGDVGRAQLGSTICCTVFETPPSGGGLKTWIETARYPMIPVFCTGPGAK